MPSNYPSGYDSFNNPDPTNKLNNVNVPHADQHTNINNAIEAIQATLGLNPEDIFATVTARLADIDIKVASGTIAANIVFTPAGTIAATDVQAALEELDYGNGILINSPGPLGTDEKLRVNTPSIVDNDAVAMISAGAADQHALVVQGAPTQTANMQEWQLSSGVARTFIDEDGRLTIGDGVTAPATDSGARLTVNATGTSGFVVQYGTDGSDWFSVGKAGAGIVVFNGNGGSTYVATATTYGARLNVGTLTTGTIGIAIRGITAQTASLQEWQNDSAAVMARVTAAGVMQINSTGTAGTDEKLRVNTPTTADNDAVVIIGAGAADQHPLIVQGYSAQSTNLQEWQDSAGAILVYVSSGGAVSASGGFVKRITAASDATSITPNCDTSDIVTQANTQAAGTLTINAPTGTPINGQEIVFRIKNTNAQTFSFNATYRGSLDTPLPTATYGGSTTCYMKFIYHSTDSKWDLVSVSDGY